MSTTGKEYKLAIRIAGVIDKSFTTSLATANTALRQNIATLDKNFVTLDKGFDKIMSSGQKCFSAIATAAGVATLAIGAATAASIAVGSEFESAFASVKKTVDATEEEYERLKQDILEMSRVLPSSQAEIAEVMAIAGQLGIDDKGIDNLTEFTETMINLGVSTNLSAEEAATALAKFANITGMDPANYERLGSVIVDLGNNFATTEADIVQMATRLASTGDLVGLSESQIMALATAMSSVGIASETGGSTMSKLLKKMQVAVETNSDSLADYASVAGMTGEQFKQTFQEDAVVAMSAFIGGLNDTERNGKSAIAILDDMKLNEVRLSNTILALAGGEDVMSDAIATANEAWKENTALAIEAGKRYETAESQLQVMQNAFKELGIVAYEDLRGPFVDTIGAITEGVYDLTEYVGSSDGISKWLRDIGTELPTLQRKVKKHGEDILEFFDPLIDIGKWFLKNPKVIASALIGIGSALATYKIASTLVHVVNALMTFASMGPVTLGIMGVVGAVGLLAGAFAGLEMYLDDMTDQNLAEHFGNIALSMEEIQAVAEYILNSNSLSGVKEALSEFEEIDEFASVMEDAVAEINKMNWKVSIGMELTEDEQAEYKAVIDEYVAAAQEYVLQSQYAVSLNLKIGMGDASDETMGIAEKVNQFYADSYAEMVSLGEDLSAAVNDAFSDKILDPEEIVAISDLQAKMAKLQEALATGEFDAQLSVLGMKYANGAALTPDSFMNLQEELGKQIATASAAYEESYAKNYASASAALKEGAIDATEFAKITDALQQEYFDNISSLASKGAQFQLDTISGQYMGDISDAAFSSVSADLQWLQEQLGYTEEQLAMMEYDPLETYWMDIYQNLIDDENFSETRRAVGELMKSMEPTIEEMENIKAQYEQLGKEIPEEIASGLEQAEFLKGIANGDMDSIYQLIGAQMSEGEYGEVLSDLIENGRYVPESLAKGMTEAQEQSIKPAVEGMYAWTQSTINDYYSSGFTTESDVSILLKPTLSGLSRFNLLPINQRANGGLATRPELTWFAEKGPEMAIPIDGSRNAISLWEQTGRLLGMNSALDGLDLSSGGSPRIEYSPTLQFYGDAPSQDDLTEAMRISQDEFDSLMERYFMTHRRVSY